LLSVEARRSAGFRGLASASADQVRAGHQSHDRQGNRAESPGTFLLRADEIIE
jgi:hypothetical protein